MKDYFGQLLLETKICIMVRILVFVVLQFIISLKQLYNWTRIIFFIIQGVTCT